MEALVGVLVAAILILVAYVAFTRLGSRSRESVQGLKAEFQTLSQEALKRASEQFLTLAEERFNRLRDAGSSDLQGMKLLIDQQLQNMKGELEKVANLVQTLEKTGRPNSQS